MNSPTSALADLFPDEDYRFHLTLRKGDPAAYFRPTDPTGRVLAERRRLLATDPAAHIDVQPEGAALVQAFADLAGEWGLFPAFPPGAAAPLLAALSSLLEPDLLFLAPDVTGAFRLRAGALCFPTGWALQDKIGHPIDFIHGVVPGLNSAIGPAIGSFLSRLKPGPAFFRANWGLAANDELNHHPKTTQPAPSLPSLDAVWLRVEHQALLALPDIPGVVFAIRIANHRLDTLPPEVRAGLGRALRTMPAEVAAYKRLDAIREPLLRVL